jgi:LmbE family N-acetylglucosaminyl deacetylase
MSAARILIVIPHPDDEVVGCAVAMGRARAAGAALFGLYLTTGVPPGEALWPWQNYANRVARRRREAEAVAAALGLAPVGFGERPARRLKSELALAMAELRAASAACRPEQIWVSAWEGGHQDHDVANFLASRLGNGVPVLEYAEYNFAGGGVRSQAFPDSAGEAIELRLTPEEAAAKRRLLRIYRSERGNLRHVRCEREALRPLPRHRYDAPPHRGRLFRERFHWVPFRHPRIDFEATRAVLGAIAAFSG